MTFNMYIEEVNKDKIIELFSNFSKNTFEYQYIFEDCVPYYDKNNYWDTKPIILFDEGEVSSICFYRYDNYKSLKYLDIKRIMTVTDKRGQGHGTILLNTIKVNALQSNIKYIRMFCNFDSLDFYKKNGYYFHGETDNGYAFVFQPLVEFSKTDEVYELEKKFIKEQLEKYNGHMYN